MYQFLLEAVLGGKCILVTSNATIHEIRDVLGRPKFRLDKGDIDRVTFALESLSEIIETKSKFKVSRDPNDDIFINTVYDGRRPHCFRRL